MRTEADTQADRTAEVVPAIDVRSPWRVRTVRVAGHGLLEVQFADDTQGTADLRDFLNGDKAVGTMFEPLRDPSFFLRVGVHLGAVEWPGEIDLAPDAMYQVIRANGTWVLV